MNIAAKKHGIKDLENKKVVIFGAGPVGRIAAILAAKIKCDIFIVETWDKSSKEFINNLARELQMQAGEGATKIKGIFAPDPQNRFEISKTAEIIWCLAAAGVEILSTDLMKQLSGKKIVVDINLVPPYGIEGLKPKHKNEEIYPGIFGIGAIALGRLKSLTEGKILKEAANSKGLKVFDYTYAFDVATKLLVK